MLLDLVRLPLRVHPPVRGVAVAPLGGYADVLGGNAAGLDPRREELLRHPVAASAVKGADALPPRRVLKKMTSMMPLASSSASERRRGASEESRRVSVPKRRRGADHSIRTKTLQHCCLISSWERESKSSPCPRLMYPAPPQTEEEFRTRYRHILVIKSQDVPPLEDASF